MTKKEFQNLETIGNRHSYWAKKFDKVAHVVHPEAHIVLCGKYGALLGNNYAGDLETVCPKCARSLGVFVPVSVDELKEYMKDNYRYIPMENVTDVFLKGYIDNFKENDVVQIAEYLANYIILDEERKNSNGI